MKGWLKACRRGWDDDSIERAREKGKLAWRETNRRHSPPITRTEAASFTLFIANTLNVQVLKIQYPRDDQCALLEDWCCIHHGLTQHQSRNVLTHWSWAMHQRSMFDAAPIIERRRLNPSSMPHRSMIDATSIINRYWCMLDVVSFRSKITFMIIWILKYQIFW